MQINQTGLDLIKRFEGFRSIVYYDLANKATIGYGHLIKKGEKFTSITKHEAECLLKSDVEIAEAAVNRLVKTNLNDNQFSALVSFVFNLGADAFSSSTLLKKLNQNQHSDVPEQILRWHRVGSRPYKGLIKRRAAEAELFIS